MDAQARGEVAGPIVLHDEDGQAFAFHPIRVLRDGPDEPYLLAADLDDPTTVIAFETAAGGLRPVDERRRAAILEELTAASAEWSRLLPSLEAKTLGMRSERIEVTDARGAAHAYRAAGRLVFQGRDLLFLAPEHDPGPAIAFDVRPGGRVEPVADEVFLGALHAALDRASHARSAR